MTYNSEWTMALVSKCTNCLNDFDEPKLLDCGHSVCTSCVSNKNMIQCASCDRITRFDNQNELISNLLAIDLLDGISTLEGSLNVDCTMCHQKPQHGVCCVSCMFGDMTQNSGVSIQIDAHDIKSPTSKMTQCPVCYNVFKKPKVLACGHTVCLSCVKSLKDQKSSVSCPLCHKATSLANSSDLPTNRIVADLVKSLKRLQIEFKCVKCKHRPKNEFFCLICAVQLEPKLQDDLDAKTVRKISLKKVLKAPIKGLHPKLVQLRKRITKQAKGYTRRRSTSISDPVLTDTTAANDWLDMSGGRPHSHSFASIIEHEEDEGYILVDTTEPMDVFAYPADLPLPIGAVASRILDRSQIRQLLGVLPPRAQVESWVRVFSTEDHGFSLISFYNHMNDWLEERSGMLVVVRDTKGCVFGASASSFIRPSKSNFHGVGHGSFLFSFKDNTFQPFSWSEKNDMFVDATDDIAFGIGEKGLNGLWMDNDLNRGRSHPCDTFDNETLSCEEDFIVEHLELWGFCSKKYDWEEYLEKERSGVSDWFLPSDD